jgi:hypothetical protein
MGFYESFAVKSAFKLFTSINKCRISILLAMFGVGNKVIACRKILEIISFSLFSVNYCRQINVAPCFIENAIK